MTQYVLEILDGDRAGEIIPLTEERVTIGRRAGNTIQLNDEKVSGAHAEIALEDGQRVLRDLESTNGTFLESRRIQEVVLTSFDVFQIGRIHLTFKEEGATPPVDAVQVHQIDSDRLAGTRSRRGVLGLAVAVVLAAGTGGYFYLFAGSGGEAGGRRGRHTVPPMVVAGNKLPRDASQCEVAAPWNLRASGEGFEVGVPAHTGQSALVATRIVATDVATSPVDHAVARLAEPLSVIPGESLRLAGFVRCSGGGAVMLRMRFSSRTQEGGVVLFTGTHRQAPEDFAEVVLELAAPPGADSAEVEVVALLPSDDAEVCVDDLSLVAAGDGAAIELRASGCNVVGVGTSVTANAGQTPMLFGIAPLVDGGPLAGLAAAGLACLSDANVDLNAAVEGPGFTLACSATPASGLRLEFPLASAADGVRVREGEVFHVEGGDFSADNATEVLLGRGPTRVLLRRPAAGRIVGQRADGQYEIAFAGAGNLALHVNFDEQSRAARSQILQARARITAGRPGEALDLLQKLAVTLPHDDIVLAEAQRTGSELLVNLNQRIDEIRTEIAKAEFFHSRGSFVRLKRELSELVDSYGERHLPDSEAVAAMRQRVADGLSALDSESQKARRARLEQMVTVFHEAGEDDLEALVQSYIERHYR